MRVLLLTQYFPPEIGATQNRMSEFAAALAAAGHDVEVLTEVPNHPSGIVAPAYRNKWVYRDEEQGYRVTRVWVLARPRKTFLTRVGFYATFFFMAVLTCLAGRQRYDVSQGQCADAGGRVWRAVSHPAGPGRWWHGGRLPGVG